MQEGLLLPHITPSPFLDTRITWTDRYTNVLMMMSFKGVHTIIIAQIRLFEESIQENLYA